MLNDDVSALMTQIGPLADLVLVDEDPDKTLWRILVTEELVVYAELDADRRLLVMSSEIGPAPSEGRNKLFSLVMSYHHLWRQTGGATLSIADNCLWIAQAFAVDASDPMRLRDDIETFAARRAGWREILEKLASADSANDEVMSLLSAPGVIRS